MARETILLTGATGGVGHEVVRALLADPKPPRLLVLMRGGESRIKRQLEHLLSWSQRSPFSQPDVVVLPGDSSLRGLGLSEPDLHRVECEATTILHMAASTDFNQSRRASRVNVTSTRCVLETALRCRRLGALGMVSTAFVAGRRSGLIREDELRFRDGFSNEYERSKALSEKICRQTMKRLPIAIYRLSIVVGRRGDGRLSHCSSFGAVCRLLRPGLLPFFPGDPMQSVDLIPADFAGQTLAALIRQAFTAGATYHVCAGPERSMKLGGIVTAIIDRIASLDPERRNGRFPRPVFSNFSAFEAFLDDPHAAPKARRIGRTILELTRPLERPKRYETRRFDAAVGPYELRLAHAREWIDTIVGGALCGGTELVEESAGRPSGHTRKLNRSMERTGS